MPEFTDFDLYLVIGLALCALAIPALLAAISDSRPPRLAAVMLVVGGGLLTYSVTQNPESYAVEEVPQVVLSVFGR